MMSRLTRSTVAALALALLAPFASADVKLPTVLGSHMVLQQGMPVPVWGWADDGEKITVTFAGQTKTTTAAGGKWQVKLDALKASAKGSTLTIQGKNQIKLTDVLVGEVWICSGQSNMEWSVMRSANPKEEAAAANHPTIRLYNVQGHPKSYLPRDECNGAWAACTPKSVAGFSAVGFYFGRRLSQELKVPIGLVGSNWGGTRIEPWTSPDGFASVPQLKDVLAKANQLAADQKKAESEGNKKFKINHRDPTAIYNAMIHPLVPFAMRGGIWYQGESNGGEGITYHYKKQALINGWRKLFNPDLAFYWVQLADFRQSNNKPEGGDGWAKLRDAQRTSLQIPNTGMAVIHDIGNAKDIHPKNKQDVGWRLAQWALHQNYGRKDLVPAGPLYKDIKVEGNKIRIHFDHVGSGLMVGKKNGLAPTEEDKGGKLGRFAVAGEDKVWHWADAVIDGKTVLVSSKDVAKPVAVRYGYTMNPRGANLYNKEGIPASPFRTDDW